MTTFTSNPNAVVFTNTSGTAVTFTQGVNPTPHAASHTDGGSDEITVTESQVTGLTSALAAKAASVWLGDIRYPMVAGSYYSLGGSTVTATMSEATELGQLFIPARSCTLDRIGVVITTTAGSSGAVIRLGLRTWDSASGAPGALIADFGTVGATTTGAKTITISQAVTADTVYMLTATCQGGAVTRPTIQMNDKTPYPSMPYSSPSAATYFWGKPSVTGALDDTGSFAVAWELQPRIFVRS